MRRKVHFIACAAALAAEKDWIFLRGEERRREEKRVCVGGKDGIEEEEEMATQKTDFLYCFCLFFFEGGSEEWGKRRSK